MTQLCFCGGIKSFAECCQPYILGDKKPETAEILMRSRYSAYACNQHHYIYETYGEEQKKSLTVKQITESADSAKWVKLDVLNRFSDMPCSYVEFKAYYQDKGAFYLIHELSRFTQEGEQWVYLDGTIKSDAGPIKPGRNDTCLCQSGKKYKKCCA